MLRSTISTWSSGTGGAGLLAALAYAVLTEPRLLHLHPQTALLLMLIVPAIFFITFFYVLTPAPSVYRITMRRLSTWIVPLDKGLSQAVAGVGTGDLPGKMKPAWTTLEDGCSSSESSSEVSSVKDQGGFVNFSHGHATLQDKLAILWPLILKYVIPLSIVYYAQYLVNQGLAGFMVFNCANGFGLSKESQYRWFQVLYQLGVFISRSSVNLIRLPLPVLLMLPLLQVANAGFFFTDVFWPFVPHISISFALILVQGFVGGFSYVNSFYRIHKEVPANVKEFSMSIVSIAGPIGITLAGLSSVPIHQFACRAH